MSTKTYVIVTDLPPTVKGNTFFYKLLKQQVSGGLLGALVEDESTVGIAIFDTPQNALAACKETIQLKGTRNANGSIDVYTIKMRIVDNEHQIRAVESVYVDTISVDGTEVKKDALDFTYGLQLVLRGEQGATWCNHTKSKQACPLGVKCKFLHLKEYQTTRKRLRDVDGGGAGAATTGDNTLPNVSPIELTNLPFTPATLSPSILVTPPMAQGLLAGDEKVVEDLAAALFGSSNAGSSNGADEASRYERARAVIRLASEMGGTTAIDLFTETPYGIDLLKTVGKCILPSNDCPTPIEKDAFTREIIKKRNLTDAIMADRLADKPAERVKLFLKSPAVRQQLHAATDVPLRVFLQRRYDFANPTVQEFTFYLRDGLVTCVTQHYDDVLAPRSLFEGSAQPPLGGGAHMTAAALAAAANSSSEMREDLNEAIMAKIREVRGKLEGWAAKQHPAAPPSGSVRSSLANILASNQSAAAATQSATAGTAGAGSSSSTGSSSFSAAVHIAFPCGVFGSASADSDNKHTYGYPTEEAVGRTPQALLINEEAVSAAYFPADVAPVVLGVKSYAPAASSSGLFSPTAAHDTRSTRPLWRRLRTSNTPMFERSTIDKF